MSSIFNQPVEIAATLVGCMQSGVFALSDGGSRMSKWSYHNPLRSCSMSLELSDTVDHAGKGYTQEATGVNGDSIYPGTWFEQLHCGVQFRRTLYTIQLSRAGHEPPASNMAPVTPALGVSLETGLSCRANCKMPCWGTVEPGYHAKHGYLTFGYLWSVPWLCSKEGGQLASGHQCHQSMIGICWEN